MALQLLGTVNILGRELLEGLDSKFIFEPKDSIRTGQVVTWSAWRVEPNAYEPKSQKDYDSLTGYAGD